MLEKNLILLACLVGFSLTLSEAKQVQRITAKEAHEHMGKMATVCGKVVSSRVSRYSVGDRGKPITFDLDEPEPKPLFFFVTWSPDPAKLQQTREAYEGKHVCVTGKILTMGIVPYIIATEPSQIEVQADQRK